MSLVDCGVERPKTAQQSKREAAVILRLDHNPSKPSTTTAHPNMTDDVVAVVEANGFGYLLNPRRSESGRLNITPSSSNSLMDERVAQSSPGRGYFSTKRAVDIFLSCLAVLILFPLMLAIALAIWLEDRGPVLYHQSRTGLDGQSFRFYKFRSMVRNADKIKKQLEDRNEADGPIFKIKNDPRITRVGAILRRLSLDELPQFFSVIKGDMTMIGPRPLYAPEAAKLSARYFTRQAVKPGLLCFREVCGRSKLSFEQWMELDLLYVNVRSYRTDFKILLRALPAILKSEGAY